MFRYDRLTIRTAILAEAVQILSQRRLSELPVIDEACRPVGLLDITDVLSLMPTET